MGSLFLRDRHPGGLICVAVPLQAAPGASGGLCCAVTCIPGSSPSSLTQPSRDKKAAVPSPLDVVPCKSVGEEAKKKKKTKTGGAVPGESRCCGDGKVGGTQVGFISPPIRILWDFQGFNPGQTVPSGSAALTQLWQPCWGSWRVKEQLFPGDLGCAWDVGSAGEQRGFGWM